MGKSKRIFWLAEPEEQDYPAARSYLSLLYPDDAVITIMEALRTRVVTQFAAKDIFRASGLSLLGVSNAHVEKDRKKIRKGIPLSPLLLVRAGDRVVIADGYHRLCAIYEADEDIMIRAKIV